MATTKEMRPPPCYLHIQSNPVKALVAIKERKHLLEFAMNNINK
jgi:hypothetical protein